MTEPQSITLTGTALHHWCESEVDRICIEAGELKLSPLQVWPGNDVGAFARALETASLDKNHAAIAQYCDLLGDRLREIAQAARILAATEEAADD